MTTPARRAWIEDRLASLPDSSSGEIDRMRQWLIDAMAFADANPVGCRICGKTNRHTCYFQTQDGETGEVAWPTPADPQGVRECLKKLLKAADGIMHSSLAPSWPGDQDKIRQLGIAISEARASLEGGKP